LQGPDSVALKLPQTYLLIWGKMVEPVFKISNKIRQGHVP